MLAVKPAALEEVAAELRGRGARRSLSLLGATPRPRDRRGVPGTPVLRVMPNVAVEVRQGRALLRRRRGLPAETARRAARAARACSATLVAVEDRDFDAATAVMGCAPAYLALAAEAIADAGAARGARPELSRELVVETAAGTAELLRLRHPADVRAPWSPRPGGSTEAGLEALDGEGAEAAFEAAVRGLAGEDAGDRCALARSRRNDVADYVSALFLVYIILIFARILISCSARMPYNARCARCSTSSPRRPTPT